MIHFNLHGIDDPNEYADRFGNQGQFTSRGYYTAVELYLIKARGRCGKTIFYKKDGGVYVPSPDDWEEFCGK